jgi:hypothetical protein
VQIGSRSTSGPDGQYIDEPITGTASAHTHAKWYNSHLKDQGYDEQALAALLAALKEHGGIEFSLHGAELHFLAPAEGYQR